MSTPILLKLRVSHTSSIFELSEWVHKDRLLALQTKLDLISLLHDLFHKRVLIPYSNTHLEISRQSKKHKSLVPVSSDADIKELKRSLKVKAHVSLEIDFSNVARINEGYAFLKPCSSLNGDNEKRTLEVSDGSGVISASQLPLLFTHHVACNSCASGGSHKEIVGTRLKCLVCEDFDLCSECYSSNYEDECHSSRHPMAFLGVVGPNNISLPDSLQATTVELFETSVPKLFANSAFASTSRPGKEVLNQFDDTRRRLSELSQPDAFLEKEARISMQPLETRVNSGEESEFPRIEALLVPKSANLAQLRLMNSGSHTIDCATMKVKVEDCNGQVIAISSIDDGHKIQSQKRAKYNIRLKVETLKQHSFIITLETRLFIVSSQFDDVETRKTLQLVREKKAVRAEAQITSAKESEQLMILPSMYVRSDQEENEIPRRDSFEMVMKQLLRTYNIEDNYSSLSFAEYDDLSDDTNNDTSDELLGFMMLSKTDLDLSGYE